jgi:hypothetical protein
MFLLLALVFIMRTIATTVPGSSKNIVRVDSTGTMLRVSVFGKGIYYSNNTGTTWKLSNAGTYNWNYMSSFGQLMGAASREGRLYTSTNYGQSWNLRRTSVYTSESYNPVLGTYILTNGTSLQNFLIGTSVVSITHPTSQSIEYVVQSPAATPVYAFVSLLPTPTVYSKTYSGTWTSSAITGTVSFLEYVNANVFMISTSNLGSRISVVDANVTYTSTLEFSALTTNMTFSPMTKGFMYLTQVNGSIYRTTDLENYVRVFTSNRQWQSVGSSSDGRVVVAAAKNEGVFISKDYGETWTPHDSPSSQPTSSPSMLPSSQPTSFPSQPSGQPSVQPSMEPSSQPTLIPSMEPSVQPSSVPSSQPSSSPSMEPTTQPSSLPSGQPSSSPSMEPTTQPSSSPSVEPSSQPTLVPSGEPSSIPSMTPLSSPSSQPSGRPSSQPSGRPSSLPSARPSFRTTLAPSSQPSSSPSSDPSIRPSAIPSTQLSASPSTRPSVVPSTQPSASPLTRPSVVPSTQPSRGPSVQPSTQPSASPSMSPSVVPSTQPSRRPSVRPSTQPSATPSIQPSSSPSARPSATPSIQPSSSPSARPSVVPSTQPSSSPSVRPSVVPSTQPSSSPSVRPSMTPLASPSIRPSVIPSTQPSSSPSTQPSMIPSSRPSTGPSTQPSVIPSTSPSNGLTDISTVKPSSSSTIDRSIKPSNDPTIEPSVKPSNYPTVHPSTNPSNYPTIKPTPNPSLRPSSGPTVNPTTTVASKTVITIADSNIRLKPTDRRIIQGTVTSPVTSVAKWEPTTTSYSVTANTMTTVPTYVYPNSLSSGYHVFSLSCNGVSQALTVFVLGPPTGGRTTIEPKTGVAFTTVFTVSALNWTSEYLPLTYSFLIQDLTLSSSTKNEYRGYLNSEIVSVKITDSMGISANDYANVTLNTTSVNVTALVNSISSLSDLALITLQTQNAVFVRTQLLEELSDFTNYSNPESLAIALNYLQVLAKSSDSLDSKGSSIVYRILEENTNSPLIFVPVNSLIGSSFTPVNKTLGLLVSYAEFLTTPPLPQTTIVSMSNFYFGSSIIESGNNASVVFANTSLAIASSGTYVQIIQIKDDVNSSLSYPISIRTNGNYTITIPTKTTVWSGTCTTNGVIKHTCPSGEVLTEQCSIGQTWSRTCPSTNVCVPTNNQKCTTVSQTPTQTTCSCTSSSQGSQTTIVVMAAYVITDFQSAFVVTRGSGSVAIIVMYSLIVSVFASVVVWHSKLSSSKVVPDDDVSVDSSVTEPYNFKGVGLQNRSTKIMPSSELSLRPEFTPYVFRDEGYYTRLYNELVHHHEYVRLLVSETSVFRMMTLVLSSTFVMAVLYDLQYPTDDGSCERFTDSTSCLGRTSYLDSSQTYCSWSQTVNGTSVTESICEYRAPASSLQTSVYCIVFVTFVSFLFSFPVEFLMSRIQERPRFIIDDDCRERLVRSDRTVFEWKTQLDSGSEVESSKTARVVCTIVLLLCDVFFIGYTVVKGYSRTYEWQSEYVITTVTELLLDAFVFETIACAYTNFLIPNLVAENVRSIRSIESGEVFVEPTRVVKFVSRVPLSLQTVLVRVVSPLVFGYLVLGISEL